MSPSLVRAQRRGALPLSCRLSCWLWMAQRRGVLSSFVPPPPLLAMMVQQLSALAHQDGAAVPALSSFVPLPLARMAQRRSTFSFLVLLPLLAT